MFLIKNLATNSQPWESFHMQQKNDNEVTELRAKIARLTGRQPTSRDLRYLRERVSYLQTKKDAGEDLRKKHDPASAMSVSLPLSARRAIARILEREKLGASDAARQAFAAWADKLGYTAEARAIEGA